MTVSIVDHLNHAIKSDVFKSAVVTTEAIKRHRREQTLESEPKIMAGFTGAIPPIAWALRTLLASGLHTEAISTSEQDAACSITVQFDKIEHPGSGKSAETFGRDSQLLTLSVLTLQFSIRGPAFAQIELTLPRWERVSPGIVDPAFERAEQKPYAVATFDTKGAVGCELGFPDSAEYVSRRVRLVAPHIEHLTQAAR